MQAEDMSIYWNQRKGQYETNNFYTEDNNTFTRTADKRLMYTETDQTEVLTETAETHVPMMSWFGTLVLCAIPGVNIVAMIAMAAGSEAARNVSQLVLLNSDFSAMPKIVAEGRRTINNLERSASLFLSKPLYRLGSYRFVLFTNCLSFQYSTYVSSK